MELKGRRQKERKNRETKKENNHGSWMERKRNNVCVGLLHHQVKDLSFSPCGKGGALW
jgi:hypothetical protein